MKNYLKSYLYLIGMMVALVIVASIISYFMSFSLNITKMLIPIVSMFIASIFLGRNIKEKAYLAGIKFSLIYIMVITIIMLITKSTFNYKVIITCIILIIVSMLGSMLGINLKKK